MNVSKAQVYSDLIDAQVFSLRVLGDFSPCNIGGIQEATIRRCFFQTSFWKFSIFFPLFSSCLCVSTTETLL